MNNSDFLGLAAITTNAKFEREMIIIGIRRIPGAHTAENVKIAVEEIVNSYTNVNKKNIHSIIVDEGSQMVRCFRQISILNEDDENENESVDSNGLTCKYICSISFK